MLKAIGVKYIILGHNERRKYYFETDEIVAKKIKKAVLLGLIPMPCMGDTLEEKEQGKTKEVLQRKTEIFLKDIEPEEVEKISIAYEPIWANGTGKTATIDEAIEAVEIIRNKIAKIYNEDIAKKANIQYTGSITRSNSKEILRSNAIDGITIGKAALDPIHFAAILNG